MLLTLRKSFICERGPPGEDRPDLCERVSEYLEVIPALQPARQNDGKPLWLDAGTYPEPATAKSRRRLLCYQGGTMTRAEPYC